MPDTTPCYQQVVYGPEAGDAAPDTEENVVFAQTTKNRLTSRNVYAADGITISHYKNTLELESIVYYNVNESLSSGFDDQEEEVKRIKNILQTPGLELKIYPVGLGEELTINRSISDIKGGPLPTSVYVQPVGSNKAILVRWSVDFFTTKCTSSLVPQIVEFTVDQDFSVDDEGNFQYENNIIIVEAEPITDISVYDSFIADVVRNTTPNPDHSYQGMTMSKKSLLSRDGRTLTVAITFKEIESDNAYYPGTTKIQVTDSMESQLFGSGTLTPKGFRTWLRKINGNVRLSPRIHKGYAWATIVRILRSRFKKLYTVQSVEAATDVNEPTGQNDAEKEDSWYLPIKLKITNKIYSRELSFDVSYLVATDLDNLFNNTKLLSRVNTAFVGGSETSEPIELSDQWLLWRASRDRALNGFFRYKVNGLPVVVNQCTGVISSGNHEIYPGVRRDLEDDPDWDGGELPSGPETSEDVGSEFQAYDAVYPEATFGDALVAAKSWVKYDNEFEVIEDCNNVPVSYLEEPAATYYNSGESDAALSSRERELFSLHGKTTQASQTNPPIVIDRGHSYFYVRMKGYAVRLGYQVPPPIITSIGGKIATRVGKNRVSHKQLEAGDTPVYLCKWDILYAIPGGDIYNNDILGQITSSGDPGRFQ